MVLADDQVDQYLKGHNHKLKKKKIFKWLKTLYAQGLLEKNLMQFSLQMVIQKFLNMQVYIQLNCWFSFNFDYYNGCCISNWSYDSNFILKSLQEIINLQDLLK